MEKFPPVEGEQNLGDQAEQKESKQPLTVEDLKKMREDLEQRVTATKKQKEADLAKQLQEREALLAEDVRLASLLEEAKGTLEYFETQNAQGLLTDQKDIAELENLKTLVSSLQEQRNAILQKYDAIMNNPEVYEKVWEEAHREKMSRELKERREEAAAEITKRVEEIGNMIESLSTQIELAYDEVKKTERDLDATVSELRKVIDEATKRLGSGQRQTSNFLRDCSTAGTYGGYIAGVKEYRKGLGLFKGKEKASVDYVLREKDKFDDADKKAEEVQKAKQYLATLNSQVDMLAEQYKTLVLDAWAKENEIQREFKQEHVSNELPSKVHYGLEQNLQKRAGLGKMKDGKWVSPYELGLETRNKEFDKLDSVFQRIEQTAGKYLWLHNPEQVR